MPDELDDFELPAPLPQRKAVPHVSDKFIRQYKKWLTQFTTLRELGFWSKTENSNVHAHTRDQLAYFKANPHAQYVMYLPKGEAVLKKKLLHKQPKYEHIREHMIYGGKDSTIWFSNQSKFNVILCLADIDAKDGSQDAQQLAEYVSETYFGGNMYIEPSKGGSGRHAYFLLNVEYVKRNTIKEVFSEVSARIKADGKVGTFNAEFCRFMGQPTVWSVVDGKKVIIKGDRGNLVKMPYCRGGDSDLQKLQRLTPVAFSAFTRLGMAPEENVMDAIEREAREQRVDEREKAAEGVPNILEMRKHGNVSIRSAGEIPDTASGRERRLHCTDAVIAIYGHNATPHIALNYYHQNYRFTGSSPEDIQKRFADFTRTIPTRLASHDPSKRTPNFAQYIGQVRMAITPDQLQWKRAEKITHERLSAYLVIRIGLMMGTPDGRPTDSTVIKASRTLKKNGYIDFILTQPVIRQMNKLLFAASLLEFKDTFKQPFMDRETPDYERSWSFKTTKRNGYGKLIAPSALLDASARKRFDTKMAQVPEKEARKKQKVG